jgi:hypothetical protein
MTRADTLAQADFIGDLFFIAVRFFGWLNLRLPVSLPQLSPWSFSALILNYD